MSDPEIEGTPWFKVETSLLTVLALVFLGILLAMVAYALAQPIEPDRIRVIDGDTIALKGERQNVRLVGFNAPETRDALCPEEKQLGERAKRRLLELL